MVLSTIVMARDGIAAADCANDSQSCRADFSIGAMRLPLYANMPLTGPHPGVRRALIVVHGAGGNADGYFQYALAAAAAAKARGDTLIVAPRFIEHRDKSPPPAGLLVWDRRDDWRAGDLSSPDGASRVGSFTAMDALARALTDRKSFPDLRSLVIAGHSAGAQFVQRYAVLRGDFPPGAPAVRFVVANPSTYLYLDARRPDPAAPSRFVDAGRDAGAFSCAVNRYKYGLERGNGYVAGALQSVGAAGLAARYRGRAVTYLLGGNDNDPNHRLLDKSCAAEAQGATRLARGRAFEAYMDAFFAPHAQRFAVVPGVGHDAKRMFTSSAGVAALFPE